MSRFGSHQSEIQDLITQHSVIVDQVGKEMRFNYKRKTLTNAIEKVDSYEREADKSVKMITKTVSAAFILFFDKEDIKSWVEMQDDIIDTAQKLLYAFEATGVSADFYSDMLDLIPQCCSYVFDLTNMVFDKKMLSSEYEELYFELFRAEQKADEVYRKLQNNIFQNLSGDDIIKHLKVLDTAEDVINVFERMANLYQLFKFKYT